MFFAKPVIDGVVVDTNEKINALKAKALFTAGVLAVCRYFPLPGNSVVDDLDAAELAALGSEGIVVFGVQHPRKPENNVLNATTGAADAAHAIAYAQSIGYIAQDGVAVTMALDMEGLKDPGLQAFAHAKAWVTAVLAAGYRVLVYIGYDCGLTSDECDALTALAELGWVQFWCDAGDYNERPKPAIGYALKQHMQSTLAGVGVDRDDILVAGVVYGIGWEEQDVVQKVAPIPVPTSAMSDTEPPPPTKPTGQS